MPVTWPLLRGQPYSKCDGQKENGARTKCDDGRCHRHAPIVTRSRKTRVMNGQRLFAWFEHAADAAAVVHALEAIDVSPGTIDLRVVGSTSSGLDEHPAPRAKTGIGFWGPSAKQRSGMCDRSINGGTTIVSVDVVEGQMPQLCRIMEEHTPIRLEDRGSNYSRPVKMTAGYRASGWAS